MGYDRIVVPGRTLSFKGVFSLNDVFNIIDDHLISKGYDRYDFRHDVRDFESHKATEIWAQYELEVTDTDVFKIFLILNFKKFKDVEMRVGKEKRKLQDGDLWMFMKGKIHHDEYDQWNKSGFQLLLRHVATWFIFRSQVKDIMKRGKEDTVSLYERLLKYFNGLSHVK